MELRETMQERVRVAPARVRVAISSMTMMFAYARQRADEATSSPYCQFNADLAFGGVSARSAEARLADD